MLRTLLLTAAATLPLLVDGQDIDFGIVNAAPTPSALGAPVSLASQVPTYNPSVAAASAAAAVTADPISEKKRSLHVVETPRLAARAACDPQPAGAGPATSPDTASAFLANDNYTAIASAADVPQGYQLVFENLQGATSQSGYLGYYTLQRYDTIKCQQYCDATVTCTAFNLYMERDPSVEPGDGCEDPPSTINYKCSLYGLPISNDTATNTGQWSSNFQVAVTASNGYAKNPAPPAQPSYTGPNPLGGAIIAPPGPCAGSSSYLGSSFSSGPYDASVCAAGCSAQTAYDAAHGVDEQDAYAACNFFVAFVVSKDNAPLGTYCAFYSRGWSRKYGTNVGQFDEQGSYYSVSQAYSYYLEVQDPGYLLLP